VISLAGQPERQPNLKKPTALRGAVGVWRTGEGNLKGNRAPEGPEVGEPRQRSSKDRVTWPEADGEGATPNHEAKGVTRDAGPQGLGREGEVRRV